MNKKRFYIFKNTIRGNFGEVDKPLNNTQIVNLLNELAEENEQLRQTVHNLKQEPTNKDWDLLVLKCAEISKRNVELDEQIGQLQKELDDCEKFRYTIFKRIGELNDEL